MTVKEHKPGRLGWCALLVCALVIAPLQAQEREKQAGQYYVEGVNFFTQSRMRDAERAFLQALRIAPSDKAAWMGLTDVYLAQQRFEEGAAAAEQALDHHPGDAEFWIRKGVFLREAGRPEEASAALRRAVQVASSDQAVVKRVKNELFYDRDAKGRVDLGAGE
ncbi:MAG: tetratricopeptide repeat protein [Thiogranum sp.]|nr:tetratricopeptide repeat protein [Thiogranum sp.]